MQRLIGENSTRTSGGFFHWVDSCGSGVDDSSVQASTEVWLSIDSDQCLKGRELLEGRREERAYVGLEIKIMANSRGKA